MLSRIAKGLKPGGILVCQYHQNATRTLSKKEIAIRRFIAALTFGNREYEPGDSLWFDIEFTHIFSSKDQVKSELEAGGFDSLKFYADHNPARVGVICKKKAHQDVN